MAGHQGMKGEIIVKQERREVAVAMNDGSEELGWFHKWSYDSNLENDYALVEFGDGRLQYVRYDRLRFFMIPGEHSLEYLNKAYKEMGALKKKEGA